MAFQSRLYQDAKYGYHVTKEGLRRAELNKIEKTWLTIGFQVYILSIYKIDNAAWGSGAHRIPCQRKKRKNHMDIIISNVSGVPIYEQIEEQIKGLIMTGELKAGDALPSMRTLAKDLRISVITTKRAYEDLERDGFLESIVGKGSFVKGVNSDIMKESMLFAIEESLEKAVDKALLGKVTLTEMQEMLAIIYEEKNNGKHE